MEPDQQLNAALDKKLTWKWRAKGGFLEFDVYSYGQYLHVLGVRQDYSASNQMCATYVKILYCLAVLQEDGF